MFQHVMQKRNTKHDVLFKTLDMPRGGALSQNHYCSAKNIILYTLSRYMHFHINKKNARVFSASEKWPPIPKAQSLQVFVPVNIGAASNRPRDKEQCTKLTIPKPSTRPPLAVLTGLPKWASEQMTLCRTWCNAHEGDAFLFWDALLRVGIW